MKLMLLWLISAHCLADFTLQSPKIAQQKRGSHKALLLHGGIYATVLTAALLFVAEPIPALYAALVIGFTHLAIDTARIKLDKKWRNPSFGFWSFIGDQALHLGVIFGCAVLFSLNNHTNCVWNNMRYNPEFRLVLVYGAGFVAVWDPACVFIKMLFYYYGEAADAEPEALTSNPNAGALIGKLERVLILVLVLAGQIGSIAFVLTAKSLARHRQLEDINFAEKYLVGTLASTALAVVAALALKGLFL